MNNQFLQALKEVARYLGQKLDELKSELRDSNRKVVEEVRDSKKTIELDLTTRAIEKLQETSDLNINKIAKSLETVAKEEGARLKELTTVITKLEEAVRSETSDTQILREVSDSLTSIADLMREDMSEDKNENMCEEMRMCTDKIIEAVKAVELQETEDDYTPVLDGLTALATGLADLKATIIATDTSKHINEVHTAIKALKLDVPKTISIEDSQFRALRQSGGSVGVTGPLQARNVEITNVDMTTANTQYSHTFGSNVTSWIIKLRSQNTLLLYSFTTGKLPTSGDGLSYATVPQNGLQSQDGVEWSGKTIYLQTGAASQVAEIIEFSA